MKETGKIYAMKVLNKSKVMEYLCAVFLSLG